MWTDGSGDADILALCKGFERIIVSVKYCCCYKKDSVLKKIKLLPVLSKYCRFYFIRYVPIPELQKWSCETNSTTIRV
jgi:hypothetical protein